MTQPVTLSILLRPDWRSPAGMAQVQSIAASLGIDVTTSGRAGFSGSLSETAFTELFGTAPTAVPPQPPGPSDFGAPGSFSVEAELPIPAPLLDYVESICVEPPATRMNRFP